MSFIGHFGHLGVNRVKGLDGEGNLILARFRISFNENLVQHPNNNVSIVVAYQLKLLTRWTTAISSDTQKETCWDGQREL